MGIFSLYLRYSHANNSKLCEDFESAAKKFHIENKNTIKAKFNAQLSSKDKILNKYPMNLNHDFFCRIQDIAII